MVCWHGIAVGDAGLELPDAVQIQPVCSDHLRTRIFRQRRIRVNQTVPARHQRPLFHLPGTRLGGEQQAGEQGKSPFYLRNQVIVHIKFGLAGTHFVGREFFRLNRGNRLSARFRQAVSGKMLRNALSDQSIRAFPAMDSCENSASQANGICWQRHVA